MVLLLLVLVIVPFYTFCEAVSYEHLIREQWEGFKLEHEKSYPSESEDQYRFETFKDNLRFINRHNRLYAKGLSTFELGINQFADLSHKEFLEIYTMNTTKYPTDDSDLEDIPVFNHTTFDEELTDQMDWRSRGAVTPVKDQGTCGSCWSFSCTGALEAQWYRKTHRLVSLSEQNLLDCSRANMGCQGGWSFKAYNYIIRNRGIDTEASYPYQGRQMACRFRRNAVGATQGNYGRVKSGDERGLQQAVGHIGPVSVNIDASDQHFKFYRGGLYDNPSCNPWRGGHLVLVIGYGTWRGHPFWLVKNSWGASWGERGYVRMARNKRNQCGIATQGIYPIV